VFVLCSPSGVSASQLLDAADADATCSTGESYLFNRCIRLAENAWHSIWFQQQLLRKASLILLKILTVLFDEVKAADAGLLVLPRWSTALL